MEEEVQGGGGGGVLGSVGEGRDQVGKPERQQDPGSTRDELMEGPGQPWVWTGTHFPECLAPAGGVPGFLGAGGGWVLRSGQTVQGPGWVQGLLELNWGRSRGLGMSPFGPSSHRADEETEARHGV